MAQATAVLALLAVCDALAFAGVYGLMRWGDADFSCSFTCTIGESVGRGLLRLSMVVGGGLAVASVVLAVVVAASAVRRGGRRIAPRRGHRDA